MPPRVNPVNRKNDIISLTEYNNNYKKWKLEQLLAELLNEYETQHRTRSPQSTVRRRLNFSNQSPTASSTRSSTRRGRRRRRQRPPTPPSTHITHNNSIESLQRRLRVLQAL